MVSDIDHVAIELNGALFYAIPHNCLFLHHILRYVDIV